MTNFYNKHTLYVGYDKSNSAQMTACFAHVIERLKIPCKLKVNLVTNSAGKTFNYAYVYVSNEQVYNAITGLNLDGTERIRKIPDPDWQPPKISFENAKAELEKTHQDGENEYDEDLYSSYGDSSGWGGEITQEWGEDIVESTLEQDIEDLKKNYQSAMIDVKLPSLVTFPSYELTIEQQKDIYHELLEYGTINKKISFEQSVEKDLIPKTQKLRVSGAHVCNQDEGNNYFKIIAPTWVSHSMIKAIMGPFNNVSHNSKKQNNKKQYPRIIEKPTKKSGKLFLIYFRKFSWDIFFCHLMTRRIPVKNKMTGQLLILFPKMEYYTEKNK